MYPFTISSEEHLDYLLQMIMSTFLQARITYTGIIHMHSHSETHSNAIIRDAGMRQNPDTSAAINQ